MFQEKLYISNTVLNQQRKMNLKMKAFEIIILKELGKMIL